MKRVLILVIRIIGAFAAFSYIFHAFEVNDLPWWLAAFTCVGLFGTWYLLTKQVEEEDRLTGHTQNLIDTLRKDKK